ncbi:hypothetical protein GCU68_03495 [Natronorubrum aibiense]|uniref:Uncharacterized protein n=1 Tax=Natronorubrum aibiense TaxID=348826 RepID=A0A5P9P0L0_9EURY|nr:hypothetical protein GCU68_03495 [Natronorubrum aibiense]
MGVRQQRVVFEHDLYDVPFCDFIERRFRLDVLVDEVAAVLEQQDDVLPVDDSIDDGDIACCPVWVVVCRHATRLGVSAVCPDRITAGSCTDCCRVGDGCCPDRTEHLENCAP